MSAYKMISIIILPSKLILISGKDRLWKYLSLIHDN